MPGRVAGAGTRDAAITAPHSSDDDAQSGTGRRSRPAEPPGFRDYVAARQSHLLAAAYLLTGDRHQAEDLLQSVLVKVWPKWQRLVDGGDPEPYIRRALVNTYCSWWRRLGRREIAVADPVAVPVAEPADPAAAVSAQQVLDRADVLPMLRALPPRQRAVIVLRHYLDLSEAAIAEALDCAPGTVKSQHAKAIAKLRDLDRAAATDRARPERVTPDRSAYDRATSDRAASDHPTPHPGGPDVSAR